MTDEDALKVHVGDNGRVWFALGSHAAVETGLTPGQFVASHPRTPSPVRVLGVRGNAFLIRELLKQPYIQLEIGGPQISEAPPHLCDPAVVLHSMRRCRLSPGMGGWHQATADDRTTYCLMAYLYEHAWDELAQAMLHNHPAWRALGFIPHLNKHAVADLLNEIIDPRWYVDPAAPHRTARLTAYLGLTPAIMGAVWDERRYGQHGQRCRMVWDCWDVGDPGDTTVPGAFLWRIFEARKGMYGALRASQKFVIFLRHTWLQALARPTRYSGQGELFIPDMLFKTPVEVQAFKSYYQGTFPTLDKPGDSR